MSRVSIDHSYEGTTATFEKDDLGVREAVKDAGFRWSGRQQLWYLNSRWSEPTRRGRVQQVVRRFEAEVIDGGRAPQTTAAEREEIAREKAAGRAERQEERAERLSAASDAAYARERQIGEHIPMGQPVLVGHYSQRRHERAIEQMRSLATKSIALDREAQAAARSAAIARAAADGTPLITRQRRIERKSADLRRDERELARLAEQGAEGSNYGQALRDRIATLTDEIAHDQAVVAASGKRVYSKADVAKGDVVIVRGTPHKVVRANAKSVTVPSIVGGSWTDTIPYHEITRVVKADAA